MPIVAYHEEKGIYLGHCLGMHFWSKLDPVDQPGAVTFTDESQMGEYNAITKGMLDDCRAVQVKAAEGDYATIAECVQAGLPAWQVDLACGTGN